MSEFFRIIGAIVAVCGGVILTSFIIAAAVGFAWRAIRQAHGLATIHRMIRADADRRLTEQHQAKRRADAAGDATGPSIDAPNGRHRDA